MIIGTHPVAEALDRLERAVQILASATDKVEPVRRCLDCHDPNGPKALFSSLVKDHRDWSKLIHTANLSI